MLPRGVLICRHVLGRGRKFGWCQVQKLVAITTIKLRSVCTLLRRRVMVAVTFWVARAWYTHANGRDSSLPMEANREIHSQHPNPANGSGWQIMKRHLK
jgi:hypothetical protein